MSLPSTTNGSTGTRVQPSIRSFFQPKQPTYAAAPTTTSTVPRPHQQTPEIKAPPVPPVPLPAAPQTSATANGPTALATPLPTPTHHPNITISPILPSHIPSLRRIISRLLPVRYPDTFYAALLNPESSGAFSRVLIWTDNGTTAKPTVIGGLICRPERSFQARPQSARDVISDTLYIQSLVLNEPYRQLGLAAALLDEVSRLAGQNELWHCRIVCAHVWTDNVEGMKWYMARGFDKVEPVVDEYYRQLTPSDAWIVRREIKSSVSEAVAAAAAATMATTTPASSYQNKRPEMEWNDLPDDMARNTLTVPGSGASSGANSRSSSTARKKKGREYPGFK